jgi:hypothetical protein
MAVIVLVTELEEKLELVVVVEIIALLELLFVVDWVELVMTALDEDKDELMLEEVAVVGVLVEPVVEGDLLERATYAAAPAITIITITMRAIIIGAIALRGLCIKGKSLRASP